MAFADYHTCDCCGQRKTFYDADLNQEWIAGEWRVDWAPGGGGYGPFPGYRLWALCCECEETHEIVIRKRAPNAQGMETREGGDSEAAPSRSDDSPVPEGNAP